MKTSILCTTVAAMLAAVPLGRAQDAQTGSSASSSVTTSSDGTATITIDVNGKKHTQTFKLGGDKQLTLKLAHPDSAMPGQAGKTETWVGIAIGAPVSDEVRAQLPIQPGEGITVAHVAPESPAAKAGLAQHDILTRLDDQILVTPEQFKTLVKMRKPGETGKITYFRKAERKEALVTFGEHEAQVETETAKVLGFLHDPEKWTLKGPQSEKWQDRLKELREKSGALRDKLKDAKDKFPGVIIDKQAFILGVDGTVKKLEGELQNVEAIMKNLREQLEKADIPQEKIDEVRKAVESAIDKAGDAARKAAVDAIREYRRNKENRDAPENNTLEAPKVEPPAQPAPPSPPIKSPL